MYEETIRDWLEQRRKTLIDRFIDSVRGSGRFPAHGALAADDVRTLMEREFLGMASYMARDPAGLERATKSHERHAQRLTRTLPVAEQIAALQARVEIVIRMVEEDDQLAGIRAEVLERLRAADRHYKVNTRALELKKTLGGI